jgi:hypothetical protein
MNSADAGNHGEGLTLRQAAVTAGFGYLLMPVSYAEFAIYPKVVIPGDIEQTVQNIATHGKLFVAAILCYLITLTLDVVIAWALYILMAPVNRAVSLLTALNLVTVYRLVNTPDYLTAFGSQQLHAQVRLLLNSFRYDWSMSLLIFGIHLVLLGYLIYRAGYIPRIIGVLLVIDGMGWVVDSLKPYLYPTAHLGFLFVTFLGELVFMVWLLVRGWRIEEPRVNRVAEVVSLKA